MHHTTVIAVLATLAAGSPANGQNSQPPPIPKEDWRLQSVMLDLLPNCKASPPATGHVAQAGILRHAAQRLITFGSFELTQPRVIRVILNDVLLSSCWRSSTAHPVAAALDLVLHAGGGAWDKVLSRL
jgi:hypothetical protein